MAVHQAEAAHQEGAVHQAAANQVAAQEAVPQVVAVQEAAPQAEQKLPANSQVLGYRMLQAGGIKIPTVHIQEVPGSK